MEILHLYVWGLVGLHLNICKPSYARSYSKARPDVPQHKIEATLSNFQNHHRSFVLSLVVKSCPLTMVTICEPILQLSKN